MAISTTSTMIANQSRFMGGWRVQSGGRAVAEDAKSEK
jgi:hypothetical protein